MLWGMALVHAHAETGEAARRRRIALVRAGHVVAQGLQHFGDTAHADAADADEVHAAEGLHDVVLQGEATRGHAATSRHTSAMRAVACGLASERADCAIFSRRGRSPSSSPRMAAMRSALASRSATSCAAPASTSACAFLV